MVKGYRNKILISGYYGFRNLGDEAILEELIGELKHFVPASDIVVASNDPEFTKQTFQVNSIGRLNLIAFLSYACQSKLFISGGGGLFQNTRSLLSIVFYGMQILLAKLAGAKTMVYAQGIGPFFGSIAKPLAMWFFSLCDFIAVRDESSLSLLKAANIKALLTADPVWCLEASELSKTIKDQVDSLNIKKSDEQLLLLSLRSSSNFSDKHLAALVDCLNSELPMKFRVLLICFQRDQDLNLSNKFRELWQKLGRSADVLDFEGKFVKASEWLALFGNCDLVVAMRLHASIMALKSHRPVIGIAYDPKISYLLEDFEQPVLNLANEPDIVLWRKTFKQALGNLSELSEKAKLHTDKVRDLACQNFNLIARILEPER